MEERKKVLLEAEAELEAILLQTKGVSKEDLRKIFSPLQVAHRRAQLRKIAFIVAPVVLTLLTIYCSGVAQLHLHAITRITLVQLLPWWDWRPLHQQRCLVSNPHYVAPPMFSSDDCVACEALDHVDRLADTTYQYLLDAYLLRNAPVVVVDAMDEWPAMRFNFGIGNITQRYLLDESLKQTRPCALTSNILTGSNSDLAPLLTKTQNLHFSKWFLHWLNCDSSAMKALRKFYQRPYFLAPSVAPAHYNWVLMSSSYKSRLYKKLKLESGLMMLHQMRGSTNYRLYPMPHCEGACNEIDGLLYEGEILVFLNHLWEFEYQPGRGPENIAILTETSWDKFAVY